MEHSNWDQYELAKLIELRQRLTKMIPEEQDEAVAHLSDILTKYANADQNLANDKDRSVVRVRVQLAALEYVFSKSLLGIPTEEKLLFDLVRDYEQEPEKFVALLASANELMGLDEDIVLPNSAETAAENESDATAQAPCTENDIDTKNFKPDATEPTHLPQHNLGSVAQKILVESPPEGEWDAYEFVLLLAAYDKLSNLAQGEWDKSMEDLAKRLENYRHGKIGIGQRDLESLAGKVFMLRLLLAGNDMTESGATALEWEIFSLHQTEPSIFAELLAEAEVHVPKLN